jgi:transposase
LRSGSIRLSWLGWRRPSIADDHGSGGCAGVRALGATDMRKGFDGLSVLVQEVLREDPFSCSSFAAGAGSCDIVDPSAGSLSVLSS